MFDHILLRQENHTRGRTRENILGLMAEGIKSVKPDLPYELLTADQDPIAYAISLAKPGAFITTLSDAVDNAVELVQNAQEKERHHGI